MFGETGFKNISEQGEHDEHDNIIRHILTLDNLIFEEELSTTSPMLIHYLVDISWIFELDTEKWNLHQKRVYQYLNPIYEFEIKEDKIIYKCMK